MQAVEVDRATRCFRRSRRVSSKTPVSEQHRQACASRHGLCFPHLTPIGTECDQQPVSSSDVGHPWPDLCCLPQCMCRQGGEDLRNSMVTT